MQKLPGQLRLLVAVFEFQTPGDLLKNFPVDRPFEKGENQVQSGQEMSQDFGVRKRCAARFDGVHVE